METCIFKVCYIHLSRSSLAFDRDNAVSYVKAPKDITCSKLEELMFKNASGTNWITSFSPMRVIDLTAGAA